MGSNHQDFFGGPFLEEFEARGVGLGRLPVEAGAEGGVGDLDGGVLRGSGASWMRAVQVVGCPRSKARRKRGISLARLSRPQCARRPRPPHRHVSRNQRPLSLRINPQRNMARCMPHRRLKEDPRANHMVHRHHVRQPGLDDRRDAVPVDIVVVVVGGDAPVLEFGGGEEVSRVFEGGEPGAVDEFGVPADMVDCGKPSAREELDFKEPTATASVGHPPCKWVQKTSVIVSG